MDTITTKYRIDYYHPFTGYEFVQYAEGQQGRLLIEDLMFDNDFVYDSRQFFDKEHYRVETYLGDDLDFNNRKTKAVVRYYKEDHYLESL
jgi:hypothetical protein